MMNATPHTQQSQAFDGRFQIRAVLLESHQQLRAAMVSGLRSRGFGEIISTSSLQTAIQTLAEGGIDLFLVDLDDGWRESCDLMRRIRAGETGDNPFIVAIALSSAPDHAVLASAIEAGFDDVLLKPIPLEQLFRRIWRFTEGARKFVVAGDYVGPERRQTKRADASAALAISVPNTMAEKANRPINQDTLHARIAAARAEIEHLRSRQQAA